METELVPIRIGTLRPGDNVNFDIYILVGDHYTHYIRTSDSFDPERIEKLRSKGVKKLFIPILSEPAYLVYLDKGLTDLSNKAVPVEQRSEVMNGAMVTEAENAIRNMETESGYKQTEGRIQKMIDFLVNEAGALKSVLMAAGCSADTFQHSATVSSLSLGLAGKLGVKSARDVLDLGIASLLHDSALEKLGFKPGIKFKDLPVADQKKYQEHPAAAAQHMSGKKFIGKNILDLIANHEEIGNAAGYPNKKWLNNLPLTSQALNLCDNFDHYCMENQLVPLDAMKKYFNDKVGLFDLGHMKILSGLLK